MRVCAGLRPHGFSGSWVDGFYERRLTDCYMHTTCDRVEKGDVRRSSDRPGIGDSAGTAIDLDEFAIVAGSVEPAAIVVDIQTVRPARWELPLSHQAEIGQAGDKDHGRF